MKGAVGGQIGDDVYVCGGSSGKNNPITLIFFFKAFGDIFLELLLLSWGLLQNRLLKKYFFS